jgi:hypothetical protein
MSTPALLAFFLAVGVTPGAVTLEDHNGQAQALPDPGKAILVVYEDQDGAKQNKETKALISAYNDPVANRSKLAVLPVADLSKWNWRPAKGYALKDVRKSAEQNNTRILIDWTGALHKTWGLKKGKNSIVLVGADGKVRFASEGEHTAEQRAALERELQVLGLSK